MNRTTVSPIEVILNENVVETNISEVIEFRGEMLCRRSRESERGR
jgi:hypothetical protein